MTEIVICETPQDVADATADLLCSQQEAAVRARGIYRVALSGGNTPLLLYEVLASTEWKEVMNWDKWEIFWSDERGVPPDHRDSNFHAASEALLRHVPVSDVWRMRGEAPDLRAAAEEYARTLKSRFGPGFPRFDTILLGMGEDGHTASLFPGHPALDSTALVEVVSVPHSLPNRLSFTLPLINHAYHVLFMVTGRRKAECVRDVLVHEDQRLPAARVKLPEGKCIWLLDQEAATLIR